MYNVKLAGLDPAKFYYVRVRAKVFGYETSEWSIPFKFETPRDTMPPGRPEQVSFISEGDSFIAKWEAPPLNEDGTPCGDISHYRLVFRDMNRDVVAVERSVDTTFVMDFNRNVQMFGIAAGKIEMVISAVDFAGNEGKAVTAIAQNPPPAKVKNVSAHPSMESVRLSWSENEDNDLQHYQIHVSTEDNFLLTEGTLRALAAPGTNTFIYDTASLTRQYFKIVAVDKFNQISPESDVVSAQPKLSTDIDRDPPGPVQNFTVTQSLSPDNATAVAMVSFDPGMEEDLDGYEIQYRRTNELVLPWSFRIIPSDETSAEIGPLPLGTNYDFKIRSSDISGNKSAWSSVVVALGVKKTSLPPSPTSMTIRGGLTNLMVTWVESADETMTNWAGTYEVEVDETIGFTDSLTIKTTSTLASFINLEPNTNYYVRIRSIDPYGNVGEWSVPVTGNTGSVTVESSSIFWSDEEPQGGTENDLWIKTPENIQYRYNGIDWVKAQDVELTGKNRNIYSEQDATGVDLNGIPFNNGDTWFKKDEQNAIVKMWEFYNDQWIVKEISNLAPDSVTATELAADSVTADKILAREIKGEHLAINTGIVNNLKIKSSIEIDDAEGHIKSANYVHDGNAGFYMDQQQLIINQGRIKAAALELQDSANLLPPAIAGLSFRPNSYEQMVHVENGNYHIWPHAGRGYTGALGLEGPNAQANMIALPYSSVDAGERYILSGYVGIFQDYDQQIIPSQVSIQAVYIDLTDDTNDPIYFVSDEETINAPHYDPKRIQVVFTAPNNGVIFVGIENHGVTADATAWSCFQLERVVGASEVASPWRAPGVTEISGDSIRTGEITSNRTVNTPNGYIPRWSINTEGNARFADAVIDGTLTVGVREADDEGNSNISIRSDTYYPGAEGWAIKGNGDVEFNNGTFRGKLSLERAGINPLPLRMTASVSDVNSYVTSEDYETVETANIRGTTYGYKRSDAAEAGVFLPTAPDENNKGNFFIGPTTEKALNIQVHDGESEDDVYLSTPPKNVTVSALNIGEQTDSSSPPAFREDHGLRYQIYRDDCRGYSYGSFSTENDANVTLASYNAITTERSPLIPEGLVSEVEYPESKHEWSSFVEYETPAGKNLIPAPIAEATERIPANNLTGMETHFDWIPRAGQSGLGIPAHAAYTTSSDGGEMILGIFRLDDAGDYILSFDMMVDSDDIFISARTSTEYGFASHPPDPSRSMPGNVELNRENVLHPVNTDRVTRFSFRFPNVPTGNRSVTIRVNGPIHQTFRITNIQYEFAAYKDDNDLPALMQSSSQPTPFTPSGVKVSSRVNFQLKAAPFLNSNDSRSASQLQPSVYTGSTGEAIYPAEAVLSFDNSYESPDRAANSYASTRYKFSSLGVTYPGTNVPYLPAGVTLLFDYMKLQSASERPLIGGSSRHLQLTGVAQWGVRLGNGKTIEDGFRHPSFYAQSISVPGWTVVDQNGKCKLTGTRFVTMNPNLNQSTDGRFFMYANEPMDNTDQSATVRMSRYTENFGLYAMSSIGGPVINIDPTTGARVSVSLDVYTGDWVIWKFTNYADRTALASGSMNISSSNAAIVTLQREGNQVRFIVNATVVRTVTDSSIPPDGRYVGIAPRRGGFNNFSASDSAESSNAIGEIKDSVNLNNGRGLSLSSAGLISVDAPGYYLISAMATPVTQFGDANDQRFQMYADTPQGDVEITGDFVNSGGTLKVQGSAVAYINGAVRLYMWADSDSSFRVRQLRFSVVRIS